MTDRYRPVPQGRLARLASFTRLAGGVATGVVGEGLRRLADGERPHLSDLILTPTNARKVTEQLSRLRGGAMKLGQMLSMDTGELLPPELTTILAQLRETAHFMPAHQLRQSLAAAWGPDWQSHFSRFDMVPIAAASIGQVHRARLHSGRELAIKVQYPGIAASIDSDVDNAATLLRLSGLMPTGLDISTHLAEAKRQLHEEADYRREADQMRRYRTLLSDDSRFIIPEPFEDLLHPTILPMDFVAGVPIDSLTREPDATRNAAGRALLELLLKELFEFSLMQTDPNFANYRWHPQSGRIVLLDFGAARAVTAQTTEAYRRLVRSGVAGDRPATLESLGAMGFLSPAQRTRHHTTLSQMVEISLRHLEASRNGDFDFADRRLVPVLRAKASPMMADRESWGLPAAEMLFIQRKIGGMALLLGNMRTRLPLLAMLERHI
jgi:predicted unusual protein kinase regulating ubiquinone biosynthesis (AarF/ABC1/UbiB family)